MEAKLAKWGNSLGLRLPALLAAQAGLGAGAVVEIKAERGGIRITPKSQRPQYTLKKLLAGINAKNRHPEVQWGSDVDGEIIE